MQDIKSLNLHIEAFGPKKDVLLKEIQEAIEPIIRKYGIDAEFENKNIIKYKAKPYGT